MDLLVEEVDFLLEAEQFGTADPAAGSIVALQVRGHICLKVAALLAGHYTAIGLEKSLGVVKGEQMIELGN